MPKADVGDAAGSCTAGEEDAGSKRSRGETGTPQRSQGTFDAASRMRYLRGHFHRAGLTGHRRERLRVEAMNVPVKGRLPGLTVVGRAGTAEHAATVTELPGTTGGQEFMTVTPARRRPVFRPRREGLAELAPER